MSVRPSKTCLPLTAIAVFVALVTVPAPASAQPAAWDADVRDALARELGEKLIESYVYEDVAHACAARLEEMIADDRFDRVESVIDFAEILTGALQDVTRDKHLRVMAPPPDALHARAVDPERAEAEALAEMRARNFGFEQVLRLDDNVGLIDLRGFADAEAGRDVAIGAMMYLSACDALVFDLRQNGGGSPEMVQLISSYLFDEPTHLNSLYWRAEDETNEFWTLDDVPGTRRPDVPVVIVTSAYTFSAAEEFTYNLQTRGRATVVGETTGGGAHPGGRVPVGEFLEVFIPSGRAINPITGTNWEGTGITPDLPTDAASAFEKGVALARKLAREHRAKAGE